MGGKVRGWAKLQVYVLALCMANYMEVILKSCTISMSLVAYLNYIILTLSLYQSYYSRFVSVFIHTTDDDIRQNEGFKNVSLGNVLSAAYQDKTVSFISQQEQVCLGNFSRWCSTVHHFVLSLSPSPRRSLSSTVVHPLKYRLVYTSC